MINILKYREIMLELKERVNAVSKIKIDGVVIAVSEKHLVKKLKDKDGLILCSNYPDSTSAGGEDSYTDHNNMILFLLEKVPSGQETDEEELMHYVSIQQVVQLLKTQLREMDFTCGYISGAENMTTEWEYDVFGGWNGLSIGLKLSDYD
jgi:hypothetical protein|uniref:hypothetical protein n=1 Tax=Bacteroides eggerthii TaxID=28111 RepID=UPI00359C77CB